MSQLAKRHLDRFCRFAQCNRVTNVQTDTQTTLRATYVATSSRAGDAAKNIIAMY